MYDYCSVVTRTNISYTINIFFAHTIIEKNGIVLNIHTSFNQPF